MPGRTLRLLFALTSLAPIALVYGAGLLWRGAATDLWPWAVVVVALCVAAAGVVRWVRNSVPPERIAIEEVRSADRDALTFLLTYGLPLLVLARPEDEIHLNTGGLIAFLVIAALVLYQMNLMHVNPLLGIAGFHFFEVQARSGNTYLLVSRRPGAKMGEITVHRLSEDLFMEAQ